MKSCVEHYASHLAPVYVWMAGGLDAALAGGAAEIDALAHATPDEAYAIDLGAGFGMHALPLATRGWQVLAVDSSAVLLDVLRQRAGVLPVQVLEGDIADFRRHADRPADLVLCMGDTLTHLREHADVEALFAGVAAALRPGGRFVATFRDYSAPPAGDARFIPVRSDDTRILTCFLEQVATGVLVHDLLHERRADGHWEQKVSSYHKLVLPAQWVCDALARQGLRAEAGQGARGMVRVVAHKPR